MIKLSKPVIFCLMATGLCATFYSCQERPDIPEAPETKPVELNLLSEDSIAADPAGGNYTIEYEIVNPIEGCQVTAATAEGSDWITNIDCTAAGKVGFNVTENTASNSRSEVIIVSYNDTLSLRVKVTQDTSGPENYDSDGDGFIDMDVEFNPSLASGWWEQKLGLTRDLITLQLLANGEIDENGTIMSGQIMYLMIVANLTEESTLMGTEYPVSQYSEENTLVPGSFSLWPSGTYMVDISNGGSTMSFGLATGGSVTVVSSGGGTYEIALDLETHTGSKIVGSWSGNVQISDIPTDGFSTLTCDYEVVLPYENTVATANFYGDYFMNGGANWVVSILNPDNGGGDGIQFDLNCLYGTFSDGIASCTYTVGEGEVGTYYFGHMVNGQIGGSLYVGGFDENGNPTRYAPAMDGAVEVTKNSDDTYTFVFELWDDAADPHRFYGSWTGIVDMNDLSQPVSNAAKAYGFQPLEKQ